MPTHNKNSKLKIFQIKPQHHYREIQGAVITIGSFDGIHRGHQKILQTGIALARKTQRLFGVITFNPIPQRLIYKHFHFVLTTDKEKFGILKEFPIDFIGMIRFTSHIKDLAPRQFILDYIINTIHPLTIVVGEDHHFGKEQTGNFALLSKLSREFGFELKVVSALKYHHAPIKSTRIRELLILGNVKRVRELLGRPYSLSGTVVKGKGLATKLGFPTLNLHIREKEKLVPNDGVYYIRATYQDKKYQGVMNIGFAPTVTDKTGTHQIRALEVHLFNFNVPTEPVIHPAPFDKTHDIRTIRKQVITEQSEKRGGVHKEITIEFFDRLRPEKKFDSLEELKNQIGQDIQKAKSLL